jgi:hypothetical protein
MTRATDWLLRPGVEASIYHYFWRLGALSELPGASPTLLDHDFRVVQNAIAEGLSLDKKLNYHAFLLDCAANCNRGGRYAAEATALLARLRSSAIDPTPLLWGYVSLERAGHDPAALRERTVELVLTSLQDQNGCQHLSGLSTATAFAVFNICRSPALGSDPRMKAAVLNCAKWLVARQNPDGAWPVEPPLYNGDPQCQTYFTGVAIRALAEYIRAYAPTRLAEVYIADWRFRRALGVSLRRLAVLLGIAGVTILGAILLPDPVGRDAAWVGLVASCIQIGLFVPNLHGVVVRLRPPFRRYIL